MPHFIILLPSNSTFPFISVPLSRCSHLTVHKCQAGSEGAGVPLNPNRQIDLDCLLNPFVFGLALMKELLGRETHLGCCICVCLPLCLWGKKDGVQRMMGYLHIGLWRTMTLKTILFPWSSFKRSSGVFSIYIGKSLYFYCLFWYISWYSTTDKNSLFAYFSRLLMPKTLVKWTQKLK